MKKCWHCTWRTVVLSCLPTPVKRLKIRTFNKVDLTVLPYWGANCCIASWRRKLMYMRRLMESHPDSWSYFRWDFMWFFFCQRRLKDKKRENLHITDILSLLAPATANHHGKTFSRGSKPTSQRWIPLFQSFSINAWSGKTEEPGNLSFPCCLIYSPCSHAAGFFFWYKTFTPF